MSPRTAAVTAMLLLGGAPAALGHNVSTAGGSARWLFDPLARCYVFYTDGHPADAVTWSGACVDRRASGPGTATFLLNGRFAQATSGIFALGAASGETRVVWADGARFEGAMTAGRPDGHGVLIAASGERLEGSWTNGRFIKPPVQMPASAPQPTHQASGLANADPVAAAPTSDGIAAVPVPATWLDAFKGGSLVAVDGTTLSVSASSGGIALLTPAAFAQPAYLKFLNSTQGVVADAPGATKAIGVFKLSDAMLAMEFAAGGSETITRTDTGGLTIAVSANRNSGCAVWYPQGHTFTVAEREAAVAAYANKLGLAHAGFGSTPGCAPGGLQADSAESKGSAPAHSTRAHHPAPTKTTMLEPPRFAADPITVRESQIHLIDGAAAAQPDTQAERNVGPADRGATSGRSPSQCLSVEADGEDLGFRNHCGFDVQFAYCVEGDPDFAKSCGTGAPIGGVAANGFGRLFAQQDMRDAEHQFRWIACSGARGAVVPKLVRTDPPVGQCVRARAS